MAIAVSLLTDEVSPVLADGLRMAADEGLDRVDIRSIGGVNFLSLPEAEQKAAAQQIRDTGLAVGTLATPLLKWAAAGHTPETMGDQFGFERRGRSDIELYEDAFRCAELLGAKNIRVFSLLKHDGFHVGELDSAMDCLTAMGSSHDCTVHIENEHVCNIFSVPDLIGIVERWHHPRLKALLDIPNAWRRARPTLAEIEAVLPHVEQLHFKDWSEARGRFVALGEGDIPFAELLAPVYRAAASRDLTFVVETHVPDEQPAATLRSVRALQKLARVPAH